MSACNHIFILSIKHSSCNNNNAMVGVVGCVTDNVVTVIAPISCELMTVRGSCLFMYFGTHPELVQKYSDSFLYPLQISLFRINFFRI